MKRSELEAEIQKHQRLYDKGKPKISDQEFDKLIARLKKLAPQSSVLKQVGTAKHGTVKHVEPMLSLDKVYSFDDLFEWAAGIQGQFNVQPKYDGLACAVTYDSHGHLVRASTRGGGIKGDDITANARQIFRIPHRAKLLADCEVRGEIVMKKSVFEKKYAEKYANARNLVAGAVQRKGEKGILADLIFVAYELVGRPNDYMTKLYDLSTAGFLNADTDLVDRRNLKAALESAVAKRNVIDFETDGVVVKSDSFAERQALGATEHHPKWAIAYKFQGERDVTVLKTVIWQVSRTGTVTPVAIVKPVKLSGATVERCTLHHFGQFKALQLRKGDTIAMTRRGGIIPHVEGVVKQGVGKPLLPPPSCPSCASPLEVVGETLRCTKPMLCPQARVSALGHWAGAMEMDGWGDHILYQCFTAAVIRTPVDFYRLDGKRFWKLVGRQTAKNLISEVERTKKITFEQFMMGIGIEGWGRTNLKKLRVYFEKGKKTALEGMIDWAAKPNALSIQGIGRKLEDALIAGLVSNFDLIDNLLEHVTIAKESDVRKGPFAGQVIVFTGALSDMERPEAQSFVRRLGGEAPDALTMDATVLVVGDAARDDQRGKREKAARYNQKGAKIEVLSEDEWSTRLAEAISSADVEDWHVAEE